jgi:thioesterase domain-containing protein
MTELDARETRADSARIPCHVVEHMIGEIWSEYFHRAVSPDDDFYDLGGDSLAMIGIVMAARERGLALRSSVALRYPTPARVAESLTLGGGPPWPDRDCPEVPALSRAVQDMSVLRAPAWTEADSRPELIAAGDGTPLHVVHSDSHIRAEREAVTLWGGDRPLYGFALPGARGPIPPGDTVGTVSEHFVDALRGNQTVGPYRLAGFGQGAVLAFEMASRLRDEGEQVELLALVDPPTVGAAAGAPRDAREALAERLDLLVHRFGLAGPESLEQIHASVREAGWYDDAVQPGDLPRLQLAWAHLAAALPDYEPRGYGGPTLLFQDRRYMSATEQAWFPVLENVQPLWLDYGIASPRAVIQDAEVAQAMQEVLAK